MILGTLAASLLENMFAGKGVVKSGYRVIRAGEEAIAMSRGWGKNRAGQDF